MLISALIFVILFTVLSVFVPIASIGKTKGPVTTDVAVAASFMALAVVGAMAYVAVHLHHGIESSIDFFIIGSVLARMFFVISRVGKPVGTPMGSGRAAYNVAFNLVSLTGLLYLLTLVV